ncbi:carbamoyl-phosphate synthase large subunit [Garciella nitratireducens]|uniref:Carbamoyl phosphate synthase large chain n=1 Tax=Garciella nitratireducens DSM 15102 TaxID=1121911 RepID=A0A1T4N9U3_9FIRM|nr:carbamoyl-phosphate synthase large subunit [Garciella nitratireducens]SJZ75991.1 carbamoyl-phosphate synthase large subunit [Garciella nitratireducens DSM 15102]
MPKKHCIKKVLVIGSGPIVIGQGAEFDYSGTQACQALREEGVEVVLINSNPATIMTDAQTADRVYIEPVTLEFVEKVIDRERPDSLLASMGGQQALNLAVELDKAGILEKYKVNLIGTKMDAITKAEDRESFKILMEEIGEPIVENTIVHKVEQAKEFAEKIGFPLVIRPAYTLGGTGGGIAYNEKELETIVERGCRASSAGQVIIEKSLLGWKEIEYEIMRDPNGNTVIICNMENIDPVGIHTGDSIVVAPSQTLTDEQCQMLRGASIKIISALDIQGGCNVQYALHPETNDYYVIEVNPRVSRSSALASKVTGYPIAKVAAKIALGYNLDEIPNQVTQETLACFEPTLDYISVKIPRWPFDKFIEGERKLGTQMKATGEVMSLANTFEAALLKAIRSLDLGLEGLELPQLKDLKEDEIKEKLYQGEDQRIFVIAQALRKGISPLKIVKLTGIHPFFIDKINHIIQLEKEFSQKTLDSISFEEMKQAKKLGFSDHVLSKLLQCSWEDVWNWRKKYHLYPSYKMVDTCSGEFDAKTPYFYSTYDEEDEVKIEQGKKVLVVGAGPIRIGQGIEFDYSSVHCIEALQKLGYKTIMVNNNPETVSTDFNIAYHLYFEPITGEDLLHIIEKEQPKGVILQFGGQTAIKMAGILDKMKIPILGTSQQGIDCTEDRKRMEEILNKLGIARPKAKAITSLEEGYQAAKELGYPLLIRPSYVLGGQGMEIIYNEQEMKKYLPFLYQQYPSHPVLMDQYLPGMEIEVDAISDGKEILIPGIMQHLERAGVHSGDSISIYPSKAISFSMKKRILECTRQLCRELNIVGMVNIQYLLWKGELYLIEVNPRASRTIPYLSKITGVPMVDLATRVMLGEQIENLGYGTGLYQEMKKVAVKVPIFSLEKLPGVETRLGPEMKSTGEVMAVGKDLEEALYKGMIAAKYSIFPTNRILVTLRDREKEEFLPLAEKLQELNIQMVATPGTKRFLEQHSIPSMEVAKIGKGEHTVLDMIQNGEIDWIVNIPTRGRDAQRDGFQIRRKAMERGIFCFTSLDTVKAVIDVIRISRLDSELSIYELGEWSYE